MNRLALIISPALLAVLVAGGYALAQGTVAIAPVAASLAVQGDGTCRGHLEYAIAPTDDDLADFGATTGVIEIRSGCARLQALVKDEVYDTKQGKIAVTVSGASVAVLDSGPRAGECDLTISAFARPADATAARLFRPREVTRVRAAPTCAPLTNLIDNSCWVARGAWPPDAPFPASLPRCP